MTTLPDMHTFVSRLRYRGRLRFESGHRIGAERTLDVDAADLPILTTVDGQPYIPGSSFKGAWRSYTEAVLRTLQANGDRDGRLACIPITRDADDQQRCLPQSRVKQIKERYRDDQEKLDTALREESCWACRVFGNGHLAAKAMVKDIMIRPESFLHTQIRDGVAIDRDSGRAATGFKYQFETVPAGAVFDVEIMVENASAAELGVAMLGLRAFERGDVPLGGAKSRGLGWCQLEPDWEGSDYVTADNLLTYVLRDKSAPATGVSETDIQSWLDAVTNLLSGKEA
jgi:CRISPR-associated protein Csm3